MEKLITEFLEKNHSKKMIQFALRDDKKAIYIQYICVEIYFCRHCY